MVSAHDRAVARHTASIFGGHDRIDLYGGDDDTTMIPVVRRGDSPDAGLTAYGTVGLSAHENPGFSSQLGVEFIAAAQSDRAGIAEAVAGCATRVMTGDYSAEPGFVYPRAFAGVAGRLTVPHALLWAPISWTPHPDNLQLGDKTVTWLQLIPISDAELSMIDANDSVDALLDLFDRAMPDIYDLGRRSSI